MKVACSRCGREEETTPDLHLPLNWEGPPAVCPGCQFAEWHPHCTSVRADFGYGERIDIEALERGEATVVESDGVSVALRSFADVEAMGVGWCDHIDLTISHVDDGGAWPETWTCPECAGTTFEWVHGDYQGSGLKGTTFGVELDEDA